MCERTYVSLLHDSASGGARTALAPCLETWLAPWLAPRYGSRQPTLYLLAMILLLLLVGSLHTYQQQHSMNNIHVRHHTSLYVYKAFIRNNYYRRTHIR